MSTANIAELIRYEPDEERTAQASYSSITLHRKCPQAWYYRYGLKLEPDTPDLSPFLTIGRWWSAFRAAERLERGRNAETLLQLPRDMKDLDEGYEFDPKTVTISDVLKAAEKRWTSMSIGGREAFEEKLDGPLHERLRHMHQLWELENKDRFDREQVLAVEMFWKRELPRPEGDRAWSLLSDTAVANVPRMHLIGYIDGVYYDRLRKMVVVQDDKAQSDLANVNSAFDDIMDSQLQLYAWGAAPALKRLGVEAPRAVSYDRVRSVAPKTPVMTAAGGLSKAVTMYDEATYREWALESTRPSNPELEALADELGLDDFQREALLELPVGRVWGQLGEFFKSGAKKGQAKFGVYSIDEKVLANLSTPVERGRWVKKTFKPLNTAIITTHLRSAVDTAQDIYMTQVRAEHTGEGTRNLDRRGCQMCDFQDICRAQIIGGPRGEYDLPSLGLRVKKSREQKEKEASRG